MDPFSITVGTLTVAGAVTATAKMTRTLLQLRDVPEELRGISTELQNFEAILERTQAFHEKLGAIDQSDKYTRILHEIEGRANSVILALRQYLYQLSMSTDHDEPRSRHIPISFSKRAWLKYRKEILKCYDRLKNIKGEINSELITTASWMFMNAEEIRAGPVNTEFPVPVGDVSLIKYGAEVTSNCKAERTNGTHTENLTLSPPLPSRNIEVLSRMTRANSLCKQWLCDCQCHKTNDVHPLSSISGLLGSTMLSLSGTHSPFIGRRACSQRSCQARDSSVLKATYHPPSWSSFLRRLIVFQQDWTPLDGYRITLRFPRVVPSSSPIFAMAHRGNITGIRNLLDGGFASVHDVSAYDHATACGATFLSGHFEMARYLMNRGTDASYVNQRSRSYLDYAHDLTLQGRISLETLVSFHTPDSPVNIVAHIQKRKFSLGHLIVLGLSTFNLEEYLNSGCCDIDARCSLGQTPLGWAVQMSTSVETVRLLIRYGADIRTKNFSGQTLLHLASKGSTDIFSMILTAACNRVSTDDNIDVEKFGQSCGQQALCSSELCYIFVNQADRKGRTAMHSAARNNNIAQARLLKQHGAKIDEIDAMGRTPLLNSVYWNQHETMRFLLESNACVDKADEHGAMILHYAGKYGNLETLRILAEQGGLGINLCCVDKDGYLPRDVFRQFRCLMVPETDERSEVSEAIFVDLCEKYE